MTPWQIFFFLTYFWGGFFIFFHTLQLVHWQSDALTTRLDLIRKLPPVSTTPAANFATSLSSVVDTGGKFATGVNDTGGKFAAGVNDTGGKQCVRTSRICVRTSHIFCLDQW
jgi:hypothetical protein